jgi:hypothetical protein
MSFKFGDQMKRISVGAVEVPAIGLGTYKLTGPTAIDIMLKGLPNRLPVD